MKKTNKLIPSLSDQTFKVMEVDGHEEIFAQDFHSDEWNDGQVEFGVKKINQLADTTKEQANTINELIKRIQQLEEESQRDIYCEGEYKWMSTGVTSMPKGWIKVDISLGYTLVVGNQEGETEGIVGMHSHTIPFNTDSGSDPSLQKHFVYEERPVMLKYNPFNRNYKTLNSSEDLSNYNMAAGIHAELWQYDPTGKFAKLREEAIKKQRLEEELKSKKEKRS